MTEETQNSITTETVEKQQETAEVVGKPFPKGKSGNPNGRPKKTQEQRIIEKTVKQYLKEYEQDLSKALPELNPVLIAKAREGNMQAFTEIHKVIGAHKRNEGNTIVPIQINFGEDKENFK